MPRVQPDVCVGHDEHVARAWVPLPAFHVAPEHGVHIAYTVLSVVLVIVQDGEPLAVVAQPANT